MGSSLCVGFAGVTSAWLDLNVKHSEEVGTVRGDRSDQVC